MGYTPAMCGRYVRRGSAEGAGQWFDIQPGDLPQFDKSYNVAPQSTQPVVVFNAETARREMRIMRWGLVPFWAKTEQLTYSTINARAEDLVRKPTFCEPLKRRRCLVPATEYYEWQKLTGKRKQPYAIGLSDAEWIGFAGLWDRWQAEDGRMLESFAIITTAANEFIHPAEGKAIHDRMPAILDRPDYPRWLDPGDTAQPPVYLLHPYPAQRMHAWPVDVAVGNPRNNASGILKEVTPRSF